MQFVIAINVGSNQGPIISNNKIVVLFNEVLCSMYSIVQNNVLLCLCLCRR